MRRFRRNRLRTVFRRLGLPIKKGKNCGQWLHDFEELENGSLSCLHCVHTKSRTYLRLP